MKKILVLIIYVILALNMFGQVPEAIGYQAVLRESGGKLLTNKMVSMRISILQNTVDGSSVYVETHQVTTDDNGFASIKIGKGTLVQGSFTDIDWSAATYFVKIEIDINGGEQYITNSINQLLSVPYALHAKTAEVIRGGLKEHDPLFTRWNKTEGISITKEQVTDLGNYLEIEIDPLFSKWDKTTGIKISKNQITDLGNLVQTETDPIFSAWDKSYKNLTDTPDVNTYENSILNMEETLGIGKFTDSRDGISYKTIKIGNQIWMAENLKYLPSVSAMDDWSDNDSHYYVYEYNGTDVNAAKQTENYQVYGVLYNWGAAVQGETGSMSNPSGVKGVCPEGWHLPSEAEWQELSSLVGGYLEAGGILKEQGTEHWNSPNTGAVDGVHFTALPVGFIFHRDIVTGNPPFHGFALKGEEAYWWTSSPSLYDATQSAYTNINYNTEELYYNYKTKRFGMSVRCVKD